MFTLTIQRARIALWVIPVLAGALMIAAVVIPYGWPLATLLPIWAALASTGLRRYCLFGGEKSFREACNDRVPVGQIGRLTWRAAGTYVATWLWVFVLFVPLDAIGL